MDCSFPGFSVHGDFPGKNSGEGDHFLLQGIFPTQGLNLSLLWLLLWQAGSLPGKPARDQCWTGWGWEGGGEPGHMHTTDKSSLPWKRMEGTCQLHAEQRASVCPLTPHTLDFCRPLLKFLFIYHVFIFATTSSDFSHTPHPHHSFPRTKTENLMPPAFPPASYLFASSPISPFSGRVGFLFQPWDPLSQQNSNPWSCEVSFWLFSTHTTHPPTPTLWQKCMWFLLNQKPFSLPALHSPLSLDRWD